MLIPLAFVRDSRLVPGRLVGDVMLVPVLVVMVFVPFVGRREVGLSRHSRRAQREPCPLQLIRESECDYVMEKAVLTRVACSLASSDT